MSRVDKRGDVLLEQRSKPYAPKKHCWCCDAEMAPRGSNFCAGCIEVHGKKLPPRIDWTPDCPHYQRASAEYAARIQSMPSPERGNAEAIDTLAGLEPMHTWRNGLGLEARE